MTRFPAFLRLAAALAMGITAAMPIPASAHAIVLSSTPAAGAVVAAGAVGLTIRFNSRIDRQRSRLVLYGPDKASRPLAIDDGSPDGTLATHADLAPGPWRLHWQVLAVDGHVTRGDIPFTVSGPATAKGP